MTFLALALVLAAAFCHATWNFFVKQINGGPELIWLFSAISVVIYLPVAGYIFIVAGQALGAIEALVIVASSVLHLGYILVLYALTSTPVVYVAPTRELSVLITVMMGMLLLGEGHLRQRLSWATLILFGVALLASASSNQPA